MPSMARCNVEELLQAIEAPALMPPPWCKSASEIPVCVAAGNTSSTPLLKTPLPPIACSSNTWTEDLLTSERPHMADSASHSTQSSMERDKQQGFFMTEVSL